MGIERLHVFDEERLMPMRLTKLAVGGLAFSLAFAAAPAFAADAKQVADSLIAAVTATGKTQASYERATASAADVTITGYKMTNADGDVITIPSIVVSGAQPRDKGGFTATRLAFDGGTGTSQGETFTWKTGALDNATVPSPEEIKAKAHIQPFSHIAFGGIDVTGADLAAPVDIGAATVDLTAATDGSPRDFKMQVAHIMVPGAAFADHPQQKAILDALGYDGFDSTLTVDGGYEASADTLTLRGFALETVDVGKLAIVAKVSGVSLGKLMTDSKAADAQSNGKLDSLSVRFDNSGVVERALDMQAKMMGGKREDVVAQLSGALPFVLSMIGNEAFQEKVATAVGDFLKNPKSLTFAAAPGSPVPFQKITEAVFGSPETLPDLLVVGVSANK
jgi:hypothetical protein